MIIRAVSYIFVGLLLTGSSWSGPPGIGQGSTSRPAMHTVPRTPLRFVENRGQVRDFQDQQRPELYFSASGRNWSAWFGKGVVHLVLVGSAGPTREVNEWNGQLILSEKGTSNLRYHRIDMEFENANTEVVPEPEMESSSRVHHYDNHSPSGVTDLRTFSVLRYRNLYPGIDLVFQVADSVMKYEWQVKPGADPKMIRVRFPGASSIMLDPSGNLMLTAPLGMVREDAPVSFEEAEGIRKEVMVRNQIEDGTLQYQVENRDGNTTLVIDPCLHWTTFCGGEATDHIRGVELDEAENVYAAGFTASRRFPTRAGEQMSLTGNLDAFAVKFSRTGELLWSTYYGGSANEEWANIALTSGQVIVAGSSFSADLPLSADAFQTGCAGKNDVFLVALALDGKRTWGTFIGGSFSDELRDIATDPQGNILVTGGTYSTNFPVTTGVMQTSSAGDFDCFVAKFSPQGQRTWATYLGGWSMDYGHGVTSDREGNIYVVGYTEGNNFPVSSQALQTEYGGGHYDGFLAKLTSSGNKQWISFFGGSLEDQITDVGCSEDGTVMFCGFSSSPGLPSSGSSYQAVLKGEVDSYAASVSPTGQLRWSSFLGGRKLDQALGLAVEKSGMVLMTGLTESVDFPVTPAAFQPMQKGKTDAFVARWTKDGQLEWASFFGGAEWDAGYAIALSPMSGAVIVGSTSSKTFPMQGNSFQNANGGFEDGFLIHLLFDGVLARAGEDVSVCSGLPVMLNGSASRGREPYTWSWSPTEGVSDPTSPTPTVVISKSTAYILTVTDADGCPASDTVMVTLLPSPLAKAGAAFTLCKGDHAAIAASVDGGTEPLTFDWSPSNGLESTSVLTPTARPTETTLYRLTATDANGCLSRDSVLVTVNVPPTLTMSGDLALCTGVESGIEATATGDHAPFTYTWSAEGEGERTSSERMSIVVTSDKIWAVTVTDAVGCSSRDSVRIRALPLPAVIAGDDRLICAGSDTRLTATASGGKSPYHYSWTPATGLSTVDAASTQATPAETEMFRITVTDKNGCASTDSVLVTVAPRPTLTLPEEHGICSNSTVLLNLDIQEGAAPFAVQWTPSTGMADTRIQQPEVSIAKSLKYQVTVTDQNGCESKGSTMVRVQPSPIVKLDSRLVLCAGSSASLAADVKGGTPEFRYDWSSDGPTLENATSATPLARALASGVVRVLVTDSKGCASRDSMMITTPSAMRVDAGPTMEACAGTPVKIRVETEGGTPPYKYSWTPATGIGAAEKAEISFPALTSRLLTVVVTDAAGCSASDTVRVVVHDPPQATLPKIPMVCHGAAVQVSAQVVGGAQPLTYAWEPGPDSGPAGESSAAFTVTGMSTVRVTVTDAFGCTSQSSIQLAAHPALIVNAGDNIDLCEGTSAKLSARAVGGTKKYTYSWNPTEGLTEPGSPSTKAQPDITTTYRVTVTDGSGCSAVDTVMIRVLPKPQSRAGSDTTVCPGSSITLHGEVLGGTSPYRYQWQPETGLNAADVLDPTLTLTAPRSLSLLVTDANGCTATDEMSLTIHRPRIPKITAKPGSLICEGDSAILGTEAAFSSYAWSGGGDQPALAVRTSGTWTVTTRDDYGCAAESAPFSVRLARRPTPAILAKGPLAFCEGGDVELFSRDEHEKYRWSNGARTRSITVKKPGVVELSATSSEGCVGISSPVEVVMHPRPSVSILVHGDTLEAVSSHSTYQWRFDKEKIRGAVSPTLIPTKNGPYSVQVTSEDGCSSESRPVKVNRPELRKKSKR